MGNPQGLLDGHGNSNLFSDGMLLPGSLGQKSTRDKEWGLWERCQLCRAKSVGSLVVMAIKTEHSRSKWRLTGALIDLLNMLVSS